MEEAKKAERAKVMSLRAYPENISFFKELTEQHENQQRAFKALCEKFNNTSQDLKEDPNELNSVKLVLEENENLTNEIGRLKTLIDLKDQEIENLKTSLKEKSEALNQPKNPLLIELTIENAQALRKVRKWLTARAVFKTDNYPAEATNLAVKYLLNQEFKNYL